MIPTSSSSSCELQPEWFELPGGEALPIPLVSMGGRGERNVAMSTPVATANVQLRRLAIFVCLCGFRHLCVFDTGGGKG